MKTAIRKANTIFSATAELYREMALMVRDDGGQIVPMFNDFIDARTKQVQGFVRDRAGELSNNFIGIRAWLDQA